MDKKRGRKSRIIPDLLNMKYEFFFKTIGRDGKYLYSELKCLLLVLILYTPGLITTARSSENLSKFVGDVMGQRHLVITIAIGVIVWFLIRFLRKMDKKIQDVNQIISSPERKKGQEGYKEWRRWKRKINSYNRWVRRLASRRWYYFQAITGAFFGYILGILVIDPKAGWVNQDLFNELYLRAWYVFLGFLAGACLNFILGGFWAIRKYCEDVISYEEILPLDPDLTGGLKELGKLSLDLDLIVALPSIGFIYLLGRSEEFWEKLNVNLVIAVAALYFLVLVFVFFVSISPAHDKMVKAKTDYLLKIHSEYRDMHSEILQKLKPEKLMDVGEYKRLSGLYELYDRVEKMAVWPLDFQTTIRFSITSLIPLISVGISITI